VPLDPLCRFSIIIPVYKEKENINDCLAHLRNLRGIEDAEVILVDGDGGSTLHALEKERYPFRLIEIVSGLGRGVQLNAGAQIASANHLIFLHVDTVLPKEGLVMVARTLESYDAGAFSIGIIGASPLFNTWLAYVNGRKRLSFTPYGDQALFMNRGVYQTVDGFPQLPIMEDIGMIERLKRGRFQLKLLHTKVLTSDRRWRRRGYLINFLINTTLYLLYRMGVSPWALSGYYKPNYDKTSKIN
jgi:rSAM/selenodomain-associated transferase 2